VRGLSPAAGDERAHYGPGLSKETAGGMDEVIRGVISDGTPRMPLSSTICSAPKSTPSLRI